MSNKKQIILYAAVALTMITSAAVSSCCVTPQCPERASVGLSRSETGWITDRLPGHREAGFGGLCWVMDSGNVQLRFDFYVKPGMAWQPVVPPAGKVDNKQADALRDLFGS